MFFELVNFNVFNYLIFVMAAQENRWLIFSIAISNYNLTNQIHYIPMYATM